MWFARVALVGSALFGVAVAALHLLEPDKDPITTAISQYVHGPFGLLLTVGFVASGVAALALATAIARLRLSRVGAVFLCIAGLGSLASAAFAVDADGAPSTFTGGILHQAAGVATFISLFVASVLLTRAFGSRREWRSFQPLWVVLTGMMAAGFVLVFATNAIDNLEVFGLAQRLFVGTAIAWQGLLAYVSGREAERRAALRTGAAAEQRAGERLVA